MQFYTYKEKAVTFQRLLLKVGDIKNLEIGIDVLLRSVSVSMRLFSLCKGDVKGVCDKLALSSRVSMVNALKHLSIGAGLTREDNVDHFVSMDLFIKQGSGLVVTREQNNLLDGENENKRWMKWEKITSILQELDIKCEASPGNYFLHQQRLLLSMYVYNFPLRLDFGTVRLYIAGEYTFDDVPETTNYIIRCEQTGKLWLHVGKDKVSSKVPTVDILMDPTIDLILMDIIEKFGYRMFLLTENTNLLNPLEQRDAVHKTKLAWMLKSIPMEGGKSMLTVDTIRSARTTFEFTGSDQMSRNQKIFMADKMRTSVDMLEKSYVKVNIL